MELKHSRNYKNMFSFIRAALVNEANREGKTIYLEYRIGNIAVDIFLPSGLSILDTNNPTVVEIKENTYISKTFADNIKQYSDNIDLVLIDSEKHIYDDRSGNIHIFGSSFVDELIERNYNAYLNYLLGEKDTVVTTIDRKESEFKTNIETIRISINDETAIIHDYSPDEFSKENKMLFKSFLNNDRERNDYSLVALFLGNGLSIPFGSDSWTDLTNNLIDYLIPYHVDDANHIKSFLKESSYAISSFVKSTLVRDGLSDKYYDALYNCVYRKFHKLMLKEDTLVKAVAKGKIKYPGMPLLTYNYDTFVEQEYKYLTKAVLPHNLPSDYYLSPSIGVIHLHGYIGRHTKTAKDIILTDKEYFDAYLSTGKGLTKDVQIDALKTYKCLFVGSSMSDLFQMSIIEDVKKSDKKGSWCCFALMCFKGLTLNEKINIIRFYREKGIYLITVDDYKYLPQTLADLLGVSF